MVQQEQIKKFSFFLFYAGLILLATSLPLSKFGMSVAQIMIALGWILDGHPAQKIKRFLHSKPALAIASIYLLHLIGLTYSNDFEYAFKDIRIKLPLLILPLLLTTSNKLSEKQFQHVLWAVILGVAISTAISFLIYLGIVKRPVIDIRDISIFISHIRLSLLCCISIFISWWLLFKKWNEVNRNTYLFALIPVMLWLFYFLFLIQSVTGIIIIITVVLLLFTFLVFTGKAGRLKITILLLLISSLFVMAKKIRQVTATFAIKENVSSIDTTQLTAKGNAYSFFTDRNDYENGYPVWAYISETEMIPAWNNRSKLDYYAKDNRNQDLRFTLIRFLTSKGFKKDSAGVAALSAEEVKAIENGIANIEYLKLGGLGSRLHQLAWEINNYRTGNNPSGHSLVQRLEYWKTAILIIKDHPFLGVGTGDVPLAFAQKYDEINSPLTLQWRLRSHNQYLSIGVAFGLIGVVWFLLVLLYVLIISIKQVDFLLFSYLLTAIISMLTEDTLETQAGITFFTLFACLFLFVNPKNSTVSVNPT
jgi:hypothetical protein